MYRRILALTAMACALAACGASGGAAPQPCNSAAAPTAGASTAAPAPTGAPAPSPTAAATATAAPADTAAPPTEQPKEAAMPEQTAQPADEQSAMVAIATQDLAKRLSITTDKIATTSVEEVEWNNGALGCPQPDMAYTQVIISGFKIVLEADGKSYNYHTDRTKRAVLCENSGPTGKLKQP